MKSKLTLLVISLIIGGIFGEIILRQFSFLKTYSERCGEPFSTYYGLKLPSWYLTLPPNPTVSRKTPEFDYTFKTNSEGLRGEEISAKQDSVFRIIVLGDSYTEGVGADADDKTWGKYLENDLSLSLHQKFEVINAGVSASDPFQEFVLLRDKLLRYQPDLVIMAINNSDIDDYTFRGGMERFKPDGTTEYRKEPGIHSFYKYSFLFRLLTHSVLGYDKTFVRYSERDKENARACSEVAEVLIEANSLCRKNHSTFIAVSHSRGGEQKKKIKHKRFFDYFKPKQRDISGVKKHTGFRLIDISDAFNSFITEENFKELVWEQDAHYTPKGYKRMADLVADSLTADEIIGNNSKKY